jgi:RNA polymerase sigma-70 factor (ECF subfamily)
MTQTQDAANRDTGDLSGLLWLIAAGDHQAFQSLYEREAKRLFAVALRMTRDERLASEALHDALLQVWRRTAQFTPGIGTAEGWLVAQVRSRAAELVRKRRRSGAPVDVVPSDDSIAAGLARLVGDPQAECMRSALGMLSEQRREILAMAFLDGMSAVEMAQRLRLPIGTIKSATRQGLLALRKALEAAE